MGLLVKPTSESISNAICESMENAALYQKLYANGITLAAGRTHERAARQIEKLLLKGIDTVGFERSSENFNGQTS